MVEQLEHFNYALTNVAMVFTELGVFLSAIIPIVIWIKKLADGARCRLRNDMLRIYYKYEETENIPQYQFENFSHMYRAYKALKGNSFIDKIWNDIQKWDVIPNGGGKR